MKIKAVCDLTGLSDRTIRYYIEEKLISPSYTENYFGRKTYNFSENDVKILNEIATLRKFDITVEEIRKINEDVKESRPIICNTKMRIEESLSDGQNKLSALSKIDTNKLYSVGELAGKLSAISATLSEQTEDAAPSTAKNALNAFKRFATVFLAHLPIVFSLLVVMGDVNVFRYPVLSWKAILLTLITFLPSVALMLFPKEKRNWGKLKKRTLILLCIICIPLSSLFSLAIVYKSETNDFRHYLDLDADCIANRSVLFHELFPSWPHYTDSIKLPDGKYQTVYLDAHYYYQYDPGMDYTYDIYAEWPLSEDEFVKEVARATGVIKGNSDSFCEMAKGDYTCLILYQGDEPFNEATNNYWYLIFAYNEKNNTVRYICCESLEDGIDQPYYLELDW